MKTLILSILLLFTSYPQNKWYVSYVDSTRAETGDGTSWATAWKYLGTEINGQYGGVDWSALEGGDTLFIDGGTSGDTTVYWARFGGQAHFIGSKDGTIISYAGNPVVVCYSQETGHNGTAIFSIKNDPTATRGVLQINKIENVKVTGLLLRDIRRQALGSYTEGNTVSVIGTRAPDTGVNTFENCTIIKSPDVGGLGFSGFDVVLRNNYLEDPYNESPFGAQDMIGGITGGGTLIEGNTFISRNNYTMIDGDGTGMTATDTSMIVSGLSMVIDYHKGISIIAGIYQLLTVDSNNATTFYGGGGWYNRTSGLFDDGTPANGTAWRMEAFHRDGFQFSQFWVNPPNADGLTRPTDTLTTIIRNNIIVDLGTRGVGWNSFLYTSNPFANQWYLIYNNIFCNSEAVDGGNLFMYSSTDTLYGGVPFFLGIKVMHNTFIYKGNDLRIVGEPTRYAGSGPISIENFDSVEVKNNLFICDSTMNHVVTASDNGYNDFDYNIYAFDAYNEADNQFAFVDPNYISIATWRGLGQDVNSDTLQSSTITFTDKYGFTAEDYRTTTGQGLGENLYNTYSWLRTDASGVERPSTGSWDIGALEFQGVATPTNKRIRVVIIR